MIFLNTLGFGIVVPLLPFYGRSFHAPAWVVALIFSAYSAGAFFGEPFWGRLSDRYGRKPLLVWTVCGNALCYLSLAFAPTAWAALAIRFIGGLTSGNNAIVQGYIADVTPPERRARTMSYVGAAANVGFIVGPAIGGLFVRPSAGPAGFQLPLFIAAGMFAVTAVAIGLLLREGRRERASVAVARFGPVLRQAMSDPVVGRMLLLSLLSGSAFTGIESVFGLWTQARFAWGPREVGLCFAAVGVASALSQTLVTGPLSERFGEGRTLAAGMTLAMVGSALQPLSPAPWVTTALLAVTAVGWSVAFPNVGALISRATDPDHQGQVLGANNAANALARVVGPLFAGLTFSGVSVNAPFLQGALLTAPAIWLALRTARLVGEARRVSAEVEPAVQAPTRGL